MKKLICLSVIAMLFVSSPASAQWVKGFSAKKPSYLTAHKN